MTSLKVGLQPSYNPDGTAKPAGQGLVEAISDPDRNGVFRVHDTNQKFIVKQTKGTKVTTQEFDLSGLVLEPAE